MNNVYKLPFIKNIEQNITLIIIWMTFIVSTNHGVIPIISCKTQLVKKENIFKIMLLNL